MTAQNYPRCLANTLNEEGGWSNHPSDPGGPTMRGVIQARYDECRRKWGKPLQSVRHIAEDELQIIYRDGYWDKVAGDQWPKGPDQIVFDIGVNSGPARGIAILRAAMGNPTAAQPRSRGLRATAPTRPASSSASARGGRASIAASARSRCSAAAGSRAIGNAIGGVLRTRSASMRRPRRSMRRSGRRRRASSPASLRRPMRRRWRCGRRRRDRQG